MLSRNANSTRGFIHFILFHLILYFSKNILKIFVATGFIRVFQMVSIGIGRGEKLIVRVEAL